MDGNDRLEESITKVLVLLGMLIVNFNYYNSLIIMSHVETGS